MDKFSQSIKEILESKINSSAPWNELHAHLDKHASKLLAGDEYDHKSGKVLKKAAEYMKNGDHKKFDKHLMNADTSVREIMLAHIHPKHWESFGYSPHVSHISEYSKIKNQKL